jgi:hypothetical protein
MGNQKSLQSVATFVAILLVGAGIGAGVGWFVATITNSDSLSAFVVPGATVFPWMAVAIVYGSFGLGKKAEG